MVREKKKVKKTSLHPLGLGLIGICVLSIIVWMVWSFVSNHPSSSRSNISDPSNLIANNQENVALTKDGLPLRLISQDKRDKAPNFELPYASEGNFMLSSLQGKIILLDFTATWCYFCDLQAPQVNAVVEKYKKNNLQAIAIDCRESKETVLAKYPSGKKNYPIVLDERGDVLSIYGVDAYPTYLILDQKGRIAYYQRGYEENFESIVSSIVDYLIKNETI